MPLVETTLPSDRTVNIGLDDVGRYAFDRDTRKWWKVVKYFHCAGGVDEHEYECKLNHWFSYEWVELEVPDARL